MQDFALIQRARETQFSTGTHQPSIFASAFISFFFPMGRLFCLQCTFAIQFHDNGLIPMFDADADGLVQVEWHMRPPVFSCYLCIHTDCILCQLQIDLLCLEITLSYWLSIPFLSKNVTFCKLLQQLTAFSTCSRKKGGAVATEGV